MSHPLFGISELVVCDRAIYRITGVKPDNFPVSYDLELISYIQNSTGDLDIDAPKIITKFETDLIKFEYSPPKHALGSRLSNGKVVYLVYFKPEWREYRYNVSENNFVIANILEDDDAFR